jgi:pyroglutamyl-peptidase
MDDVTRTVLLTGFEPFDAEVINPSWEAVRALDGWRCDDAIVRVRQVPCVFGAAIESLKKGMADTNPDLVVCVGLAGGCSELSVERVAVNVDDARIADNAGNQPIDAAVVHGAPAAYFSTLPIKAIVRDLREAGIPASVSNTAGNFVCNHIFYGLMHQLASATPPRANAVVRGGFVHVPYLPQQAARFALQPSMALDVVVAGLRIAIATALAVKHDVKQVGGRLH